MREGAEVEAVLDLDLKPVFVSPPFEARVSNILLSDASGVFFLRPRLGVFRSSSVLDVGGAPTALGVSVAVSLFVDGCSMTDAELRRNFDEPPPCLPLVLIN